MTVFTRIVAAYNDSPRALRALATAVQLAKEGDGAELIAVAVEQRLLLTGDTIAEVQDARATRQRTCVDWLSVALSYADEHGVELRTEIRIGLVAQQLVGAAAEHRADLLILGRSRHTATWRQLAGSTADKVSRNSPCPVMIVP
jgi:nucleotide-binding universal stress UspA family protein